jgi:hypothetical protein
MGVSVLTRLAKVHLRPWRGLRPRVPGNRGSGSSQPTASLRRRLITWMPRAHNPLRHGALEY